MFVSDGTGYQRVAPSEWAWYDVVWCGAVRCGVVLLTSTQYVSVVRPSGGLRGWLRPWKARSWIALECIGLGWIELDRIGLDWVGFDKIKLDWITIAF